MLQTGIPNLDLILGGGIPAGDVLLVVGPAGAGKTTLAFQTAFSAAKAGDSVLFVATLSEPPTRIIRHVRTFSFYDEGVVGKRLFLLSVYPAIKQSLAAFGEALAQAARQHHPTLVILDGLMTIRDLHPRAPELRSFVYELGMTMAALGATTIVTSSETQQPSERSILEYTMADGVVELGTRHRGTSLDRTIEVVKARGLAPLLGRHALRIDGAGLTVFPRLESVVQPRDTGLAAERVSWGLPDLDAMLEGGPLADSVTLLAGALGTGKTLASLQFIMEGARRGERGLFVGFRETPAQLADKARVFGIDLAGAIASRQVEIMHCLPVDLVDDEVTWAMRNALERLKPSRLVLDSISDFEQAIADEGRARGYMTALTAMLRGRGTTALITKEIAQVVGPELDFSDTPLAVLAENLILFRYVEFRGDLYRILSVIKMRDSDHDHSIRQYTITPAGLRVMEPLQSAEGVLTGIARLPSEMRVKRGTVKPGDGGMPR